MEKRDNNQPHAIRAIIVDDEVFPCEILAKMLSGIPEMKLLQYFTEPQLALDFLVDHKVDIIFLDINMPEIDGFEFLNKLNEFPEIPTVIFITGFEEYAIKAIKRSAFDFLLKPVNPVELKETIRRYRLLQRDIQEKQKINELLSSLHNKEKIKFKSRNGFHLFDPDEIFFIVSEGNYSWINLTNGVNELVTMQIGKVFEMLEDKDFFRISRQNIINLRYLYKLDKPRKCCYLKVDEKIIEFNMVKEKVNKLLRII